MAPNISKSKYHDDLLKQKNVFHDDPLTKYKNVVEIGSGNFATVYRAEDVETSRVSALKKFKLKSKNIDIELEQIIKEIDIIGRLDHENCLKYDGLYVYMNDIYIQTEFCVGSPYDVMKIKNSPFDELTVLSIFYSLVEALIYIHTIGIIHRDIKATNILIGVDRKIKLADFGSSSSKSTSNTFVGSPYWMAPEVIMACEEGDYSQKIDIWSLGVTAIELAERDPPHFKLNTISAIYTIANSDAPIFANENLYNESLFKKIVNSCLIKNQSDRKSAKELKDDILLFFQPPQINQYIDQMIKVLQDHNDSKFKIDIDEEIDVSDLDIEIDTPDISDQGMSIKNDSISTHGDSDIDSLKHNSYTKPTHPPLKRSISKPGGYNYSYFYSSTDDDTDSQFNQSIENFIRDKRTDDFMTIMKLINAQKRQIADAKSKHNIQFIEIGKAIKRDYLNKLLIFEQDQIKLHERQKDLIESFKKKSIQDQFKKTEANNTKLKNTKMDSNSIDHGSSSPNNSIQSIFEAMLMQRFKIEMSILEQEKTLMAQHIRSMHEFLETRRTCVSQLKLKFMEEIHMMKLEHEKVKMNLESKCFLNIRRQCIKNFLKYKQVKAKEINHIRKTKINFFKREFDDKMNYLKNSMDNQIKSNPSSSDQIKSDFENKIKSLKTETDSTIETFSKELTDNFEKTIEKHHLLLVQRLDTSESDFQQNHAMVIETIQQNMADERASYQQLLIQETTNFFEKTKCDLERFENFFENRFETVRNQLRADITKTSRLFRSTQHR